MRRLTPSFKTTYSETLQHTEEAINTEIEEREKKIQALVGMINDLEARIKDQNIVLASNTTRLERYCRTYFGQRTMKILVNIDEILLDAYLNLVII